MFIYQFIQSSISKTDKDINHFRQFIPAFITTRFIQADTGGVRHQRAAEYAFGLSGKGDEEQIGSRIWLKDGNPVKILKDLELAEKRLTQIKEMRFPLNK
ncbi:hypothetical protein GPL15_08820 [Clostridium sp. MCC353]|uniref:hypothetical protein n=1 Tax=Clostridium sp. MCC353 TaxID=2592646 RepID=UPI001C0260F5|nr:hypothetical protein [Clostridium sp. MCC353]MBT9776605.1 hypothetical protein [Clostridium sp. MCC353]